VSGPTALAVPTGVAIVPVTTAEEMYQAVMARVDACDIFVAAAAVSDFKMATIPAHKIKKSTETITLEFIQNKDILKAVATHSNRPTTVVGFAAETEQLIAQAQKKCTAKNCDMMIANLVTAAGPFYSDCNQVWIVEKDVTPFECENMPKYQLARFLVEKIQQRYLEDKK